MFLEDERTADPTGSIHRAFSSGHAQHLHLVWLVPTNIIGRTDGYAGSEQLAVLYEVLKS